MKKMKNFIALLLALVMTMSLMACGNKTDEETKTGEDIGCYVQTTETGEKVLVDKDGNAVTDYTLDDEGNVVDTQGVVVVKAADITAYEKSEEKDAENKTDASEADTQKPEDTAKPDGENKSDAQKTDAKGDDTKKDDGKQETQKPADNKQDTTEPETNPETPSGGNTGNTGNTGSTGGGSTTPTPPSEPAKPTKADIDCAAAIATGNAYAESIGFEIWNGCRSYFPPIYLERDCPESCWNQEWVDATIKQAVDYVKSSLENCGRFYAHVDGKEGEASAVNCSVRWNASAGYHEIYVYYA